LYIFVGGWLALNAVVVALLLRRNRRASGQVTIEWLHRESVQ
jgi:hypothetical protein